MSNTESGSRLTPSRRTIVKGAAWAVPAVAVAAAAPAMAASVICTGSFCLTSDFCKLPGESTDCSKGYKAPAKIQGQPYERILVATVSAQNQTPAENAALTLQIIPKDGQTTTCSTTCDGCNVTVPAGYMKVCIPASTSDLHYDIQVCNFTNSQNTTITLDYTIYRCDRCEQVETASTSGGAHPC